MIGRGKTKFPHVVENCANVMLNLLVTTWHRRMCLTMTFTCSGRPFPADGSQKTIVHVVAGDHTFPNVAELRLLPRLFLMEQPNSVAMGRWKINAKNLTVFLSGTEKDDHLSNLHIFVNIAVIEKKHFLEKLKFKKTFKKYQKIPRRGFVFLRYWPVDNLKDFFLLSGPPESITLF